MLILLQTIVSDTILSDTISSVIASSENSWFEWKVTVGDVLTLLGIITAIVEYGISSYRSRKQALNNQKETWFLNVIVLPQLEAINKFYQDLIINISNDKDTVISFKKENFKQCNLHVAELKNNRKNSINNFFDHIIALVMSYEENLGREINDIIMALEDIYVQVIDSYVKDEGNENVRSIFLENKQKLIAKLNSGLKK